MKKGGYQIIDLKEKNLTLSVGMVYDGIYNAIESTNKPIMVSGLVVGGTEYDDTFVECNVVGSNYECTLHGYKLTIQDNDVVTVSEIQSISQMLDIETGQGLTVPTESSKSFITDKGKICFLTTNVDNVGQSQMIIGGSPNNQIFPSNKNINVIWTYNAKNDNYTVKVTNNSNAEISLVISHIYLK